MATKTIEPVLARAILSEVASGGWLDTELPEDEEELTELAAYYVEEAHKWLEDGNRPDEHINAIIALSQNSPPSRESAEPGEHEGTPPGEITTYPTTNPKYDYGVSQEKAKTYPRRSSGGYSESDLRDGPVNLTQEEGLNFLTAAEGLPIPKPNPETTYDMPTDLTEAGDKPLRRLYSAFNAYSGRARWMLAIAQSNLANATHLRDAEYRKAYSFFAKDLARQGERATKDTLESFAKETDEYKEWEEKVLKHEKEVVHWRALADIYGKNVEILSREWTMRTEQYERER